MIATLISHVLASAACRGVHLFLHLLLRNALIGSNHTSCTISPTCSFFHHLILAIPISCFKTSLGAVARQSILFPSTEKNVPSWLGLNTSTLLFPSLHFLVTDSSSLLFFISAFNKAYRSLVLSGGAFQGGHRHQALGARATPRAGNKYWAHKIQKLALWSITGADPRTEFVLWRDTGTDPRTQLILTC